MASKEVESSGEPSSKNPHPSSKWLEGKSSQKRDSSKTNADQPDGTGHQKNPGMTPKWGGCATSSKWLEGKSPKERGSSKTNADQPDGTGHSQSSREVKPVSNSSTNLSSNADNMDDQLSSSIKQPPRHHNCGNERSMQDSVFAYRNAVVHMTAANKSQKIRSTDRRVADTFQ